MMSAAGFYPSQSESVGFKLLVERRKHQTVDFDTMSDTCASMKREWQNLINESVNRSSGKSIKGRLNLRNVGLAHSDRPMPAVEIVTPSPAKRKAPMS